MTIHIAVTFSTRWPASAIRPRATLWPNGSESDPLLRRLASALRRCPDFDLRVEGHTDAQASPEHNLHLSRRRASAVRHRLTGLGIRPGRVAAEGFGESRPVADNETAEGRALNRRIEFKLDER